MQFKNRKDAGQQLAKKLHKHNRENTIILALPRGGIPLAIEIAKKLHLPLDIILAKKIGHPLQPEFAIGAMTEQGGLILDPDIHVDPDWFRNEKTRINEEINARRNQYNEFIEPQDLEGKEIILVDDGIATGMTMFAAIDSLQKEDIKKLTIAVPIIPPDTYYELEALVDEVIAVDVPTQFLGAVGAYYAEFPQVADEEIRQMFS